MTDMNVSVRICGDTDSAFLYIPQGYVPVQAGCVQEKSAAA